MRATTRQRTEDQLGARFGAEFHTRRGTSSQPFPQRLSRARLLHLRRRDTAANWLALTISIALYFLLAGSPAHANPMDGVRAGSLLLRGRGTSALQPALRVDTAVDAEVSGMIARVTVRQVFRNDSADWMDGVYVFPLAEKSAVNRLEMLWIDRPDGTSVRYQVSNLAVIDARTDRVALDAPVNALELVTCFPFDAVVAGGPLRYRVLAQRVLPEQHAFVAAYRRVATERAVESKVQPSTNRVML